LKAPRLPRLRLSLPAYPLPPGTLSGEAALMALWAHASAGGTGAAAPGLLAACAASQSLYPAWERRDWGMPGAQGTLSAYGGQFWTWPYPSALGELRQQPGRPNVLHPASGLVFALYQRPGELTLLLGGTNTSDSDRQLRTFPSEAQQIGADVLNLLGRLPRLFEVAAELVRLVRSERGHRLPDLPLVVAGHSLGGGLVQYAAGLHRLPGLAFSPSALGRAAVQALPGAPEVLSISLDGDPIPLIGSRHLRTRIVGEHLRLPLHPSVAPIRRATSHGQIYPHLLAWLREQWPGLPSALEQA
jgi:hypothetical protein